MDNPIKKILDIDEAVHHRQRLAILAALSRCGQAEVSELASITELATDDLSLQISTLEYKVVA